MLERELNVSIEIFIRIEITFSLDDLRRKIQVASIQFVDVFELKSKTDDMISLFRSFI